MAMVVAVVAALIVALSVVASDSTSYESRRAEMVSQDEGVDDADTLTDDEKVLDTEIMKLKRSMIEASRVKGDFFPPEETFLTSRHTMEASKLFPIMRRMPKGGLLHVHKSTLTSVDWFVMNATYRPDTFMCASGDVKPWVTSAPRPLFYFTSGVPPPEDGCTWTRLSADRAKMSGAEVTRFDESLKCALSMVTFDPETAYPNLNAVWDVFEALFDSVGSILSHAPVFRDYVREALTELLADNVQYAELRGSLPKLYELDGTAHPRIWALENIYRPVFKEFKQQNPDFIGVKLILTTFRGLSPETILEKVKDATAVYLANKDLVVGFDLVGQEDRFGSLLRVKDALLWPSTVRQPPVSLPFFFHAGETVWFETATDENLFDAVLMNTVRIGHAYALDHHGVLMKTVVTKGIAVEVSPISNQVLKLVEDLRNHPAVVLMDSGVKVVISSDDPGMWGALPLTHDFYVTLLALVGEEAGLATMKRLARNSIECSAMTADEKKEAMVKWELRWHSFIDAEVERIRSSPLKGVNPAKNQAERPRFNMLLTYLLSYFAF